MLKEFIEHIQKTTQPLITNVNGSTFCVTSEGNIDELLPTIFHPYTLDLNSLDALVTMVRTEASERWTPRCTSPFRTARLSAASASPKIMTSAASGRSIMKHTPQTFPAGIRR